jgi:hypothetical protein
MSRCERITHRIPMSTNAYRKAVVSGQYLDVAESEVDQETTQIQESLDKISGMSPAGEEEELSLLEFHVDYDLPGFEDMGEDDEPTGIKLPYVITLDEVSGQVVGVRRNWNEDDDKKVRKEYFIHSFLCGKTIMGKLFSSPYLPTHTSAILGFLK